MYVKKAREKSRAFKIRFWLKAFAKYGFFAPKMQQAAAGGRKATFEKAEALFCVVYVA